MKYRRHSHSITNMNFHIILCSKYRKPYLHKINQSLLFSCFRRSCIGHGCSLTECEIMPDHIHMFVSVNNPNQFQLHRFINHLKGWASYRIRKEKRWMRQYKALWSSSYFCESIGNISENTIRKYIRNQKINVKPTYKYRSIVKSQDKNKICTNVIVWPKPHGNNAEKTKSNTHNKVLHIRATQQRAVSSLTLSNTKSKRFIQLYSVCTETVSSHSKRLQQDTWYNKTYDIS